MDFFHSKNYNKIITNNNKRLREDQVKLLEMSFASGKKLEAERKLQLSEELGIPPRKVAIWYQNKKARWRTQSLESSCVAMQVRLDAVMAEKRELEREVENLRRELANAKEIMKKFGLLGDYHHNKKLITRVCSVPASWDNQEEEAGSSSFYDNNINNNNNNNVVDDIDDQVNNLQFDPEFFACFVNGCGYDNQRGFA